MTSSKRDTATPPTAENDAQLFIAAFHRARRANKNKWIQFSGVVAGRGATLKSYNTWVQIALHGEKRDSGPMDCSVATLTRWLTGFLEAE